ncbi:hypothetical protein CRI94_07625 [Longibacter salinarum]|uniref:Uncharacterized protein n=1 Tax=Longibacter salinarum TaxID=1850348 RepID=A0A2A8CZB4_9BACT|nr:Ig-like domain-containing protein [Longibacter salinarum]PEN13917.1 hypothetical protein CRI94_07625 [Longibacter salinarum]
MHQRYQYLPFLFSLLLILAASTSTDRAFAQCTGATITEDAENIDTGEIRNNGWETFGTSFTTKDPIDGQQSFLTSGANGDDPNDNRMVRTPYVTVDGDVCVSFEYLPISPGPNTFVRVVLITRDDSYYPLDEVDLSNVTTLQSYQRTFTSTEVSTAVGGSIDRARIAIEFNGDNAGGRVLKLDNVAVTEVPVYDRGTDDYSNQAPSVADESYSTTWGQSVTGNVLDNDSDPDIAAGFDDGPLTVSVTTEPSNGTLTFNSDGSFEYAPTSDGADSFEYEVCDDGYDVECATGVADFNTAIPVELGEIAATASGRSVILKWTTLAETNNEGFDIEHKTDFGFEKVGFVNGQHTTTEATTYRYQLENLEPGEHTFRLRQVDVDGTSEYSPEVSARVDIAEALVLQAAGPNPFSTQSAIEYGVETAEPLVIDLFDVLGRRVRTLYNGTPTPGRLHEVSISADGLAPGRYLIRARTGSRQVTQPITVVQ